MALVLLLVALFGWLSKSDVSTAVSSRIRDGLFALVSAFGYGYVWFRLVRRARRPLLTALFVLVGLVWTLPFALRAIWPTLSLRLPLYGLAIASLATILLCLWAGRAAKDAADPGRSGLPD